MLQLHINSADANRKTQKLSKISFPVQQFFSIPYRKYHTAIENTTKNNL